MDKTTIIDSLKLLGKAQVGTKLCKTDQEWYSGSGIVSFMTAITRTLKGESRQDILDIMKELANSLESVRQIRDINVVREIANEIASAIPGMVCIQETYKDDPDFIEKFKQLYEIIISFKDSHTHHTQEAFASRNVPLHKYQPTNGFTQIGSLVNSAGSSFKIGVVTMESLIAKRDHNK